MGPGNTFAKIMIHGFVLVFCLIAIGLLYGAVVNFEDGQTTTALMMLVSALVFGGFGAAVYALVTMAFRSEARQTSLQKTHPNEPWLWREDWVNGRIRSTGKAGTVSLWVFTVLWNLVAFPLLIFLPEAIFEEGNYAALLGLLFPIVGVGLLVAAVRKTIQWRRYGAASFHMEKVPGVLGGAVGGTIVIQRGLPTAESLTVRLSCVRRKRQRSGKSTSTVDTVLWEAEPQTAPLMPGAEGHGAAVRFSVPYDASPTGDIDDDTWVLWKLDASASVPGVDFSADFEIPVFKTGASSAENTEEHLRSEELAAETPAAMPEGDTGFIKGPGPQGGTEFILPPRGALSGTLGGIITILVLGGIAALLFIAGAPFLFPLVFGVFAAVILFAIVFGAFGRSSILVEEGNVTLGNSLFGITKRRRIPCSSVAKIGVKGEAKSRKGAYISVLLTLENGKTASPLQFLHDRRQAEWLAEELRRAMAPWRSGSGEGNDDGQRARGGGRNRANN